MGSDPERLVWPDRSWQIAGVSVSRLPFPQSTSELDETYRRSRSGVLRRIVAKFGAGPPDPEDAVHAAFERYAGLADRDRILDPDAFLYRSAVNFVLDHHRRSKVCSSYATEVVQTTDQTDELDAERVFDSKERLAIVEEAIARLDPRRREVLIMARIQGASCAEIARKLDRSPTLIKMLLSEALVHCHRALRDAGAE